MNNMIAYLLTHLPEETPPDIVSLDQPIRIAAMSMSTDLKRIYRDVPRLAKRFREFKRGYEIPYRKDPWAFAAVSLGFDVKTGAFTYVLGDVVTEFGDLPTELQAFEIPPAKYAVFKVRPRSRFGWGIAFARTKRHAYETWLPGSGFEQGRIVDDFEFHDERSTRAKDPEVDLYVCIRDVSAHDARASATY
jgi:predicted transcriptional regulator YdeE